MWRKIWGNYKLNLVSSIIFFIIGCLNFLMNYEMCRFFHLTNMVVAFIPFLLSSTSLIIFYKKKIKAGIRITISIIMIILYCVLLIVNFGGLLYSEILDTNTDINNYPRLIRIYGNSDEMKHFPKKIPENAKNVELQEWPQVLQGGAEKCLSYDIDEKQEEEIDKEFREKSKYIFESMEEIKKAGKNIYLNSKMSEAIGNKLFTENSDNFRMYILGAKDSSGNESWNHGFEYGVIVNRDKHRIIYFAEHW